MLDVVHQFALARYRFCVGRGLGEFRHHVDDELMDALSDPMDRLTGPFHSAIPVLPTCYACHGAITKLEQRRGEFTTEIENGQTIWRHLRC